MSRRMFSVAIAAIVAVGAAAGARSASQQYLDPLGDATCCLDIAAVTVSNDVDGMLTFRIELPNQPVADPALPVTVWLDTDLNHSTGGGVRPLPGQPSRSRGPDYRIRMAAGADPVATLDRLSVTEGEVSVSSLTATYDRGWTVTFDRRLLGGPAAFEFFVLAGLCACGTPALDDAPDLSSGTWGWRYETGLPPLAAPKPTLTAATRPKLLPSPPRAGRTLVARLPFTLTGAAGVRASVRCGATVGGRALRATRAALGTNGEAVCAWALPRTARGKLLRGSVIVSAGSASALRRFTAAVR